MNKLLSVLVMALLVTLTACGEPAITAEVDHGGGEAAGHAEDESGVTAVPGAAQAGEEGVAVGTAAATPGAATTEAPPATAAPATEPGEAALPGDPAVGETLFSQFQPAAGFACATCHRVDSEEQLVGPGLLHLPTRAATRVPGLSAQDYLRQSIVEPGAYVVAGYPDQVMPRTYGDLFSQAQIDDLVAYLLTLP